MAAPSGAALSEMCIPIFFVCGEQESVKALGPSRFCANCGAKVGGGLLCRGGGIRSGG